MLNFNSFGLLPAIKKNLSEFGHTIPTPIQAQAIPSVMKGKDLLGIAQTGTGKTNAFSLPIIHNLGTNWKRTKSSRVRALILTPTRELAIQIEDNMKIFSKGIRLRTASIFGGVGYHPQIMNLAKGIDILVATPGRLLDHIKSGHILFDQLEIFVLDEADRMLDMGFIGDIKKIISFLPEHKQTLLFSATMPGDISKLATSLLHDPLRVEVTPQSTTVEKIEQKVRFVAQAEKSNLLRALLQDESIKTALVFTRTKNGANKVVKRLEDAAISTAAIHGNKSQSARQQALNEFKEGKIRVLVATDIAARGIDVSKISHVINYDLPVNPESYVHRIGRTARAGETGMAISFCDRSEMQHLRSIERLIKCKITVDQDLNFSNDFVEETQPEKLSPVAVAPKEPLKKKTGRSWSRSNRAPAKGKGRPSRRPF